MMFSASSFERVQRCAASSALPQNGTTSQYAEKGIDGHAALAAFVCQIREGVSLDAALVNCPDEWAGLCESIAPMAPHLRPELAFAMDVTTGSARVLGENIQRHYQLEDNEVAGTADLAGTIDDVAVVIDLKTGFADVAHPERNQQLAMLALMAERAWGCNRAKVAIVRCHEGGEPRWVWADLDVFDLDQTFSEVQRAAVAVHEAAETIREGRLPSTQEGAWCRHCNAVLSCPSKQGLIKRLANGAEMDELDLMLPLDSKTAGIAWERLQTARRLLQRVEAACHSALEQFGALELPSGKLLKKVTTDGNERLHGDTVHWVVDELFGEEAAFEVVERTATKKRLEETMRKMLGRGGAAKAREVLDEVRRRGGVTRGTTTKLVEVDAASRQLGDGEA
jgi:hypothetical protein